MPLHTPQGQALSLGAPSRGVARHPDARVELEIAAAEHAATHLRRVAKDEYVCSGCKQHDGATAAVDDPDTWARVRPPNGCDTVCRCRIEAVVPPAVEAWFELARGGHTLARTRELLAAADLELREEYSTPEEARALIEPSKDLERRLRPVIKALRGDAGGALDAAKRRRKREQCHRPGAPAVPRCANCLAAAHQEKLTIAQEVEPRRAIVAELMARLNRCRELREEIRAAVEAGRRRTATGGPHG